MSQARLEIHGQLVGDVDGTPLSVTGRGREVVVRTDDLRAVRAGLPDAMPSGGRRLPRLLRDAGITVHLDTGRGRVASVGDVGPLAVRPGSAWTRAAGRVALYVAAVVAVVAVVVRRRR